MNLPNRLTLARLVLTAGFVIGMQTDQGLSKTIAFVLFVAASVTDYLDGYIARKYQLITDFGKLMDPVADKILTASAFICLVDYGALPAWAVVVIISREFLITGLRSLAAAKGIILPAEKIGKHKTAWQITTILFFLLLLSIKEWFPGSREFEGLLWHVAGPILVGITLVLTVYSGLGYLWRNRNLISSA